MQNLATNVVDLCGVNQATFLALVNDGRVLVWDAEQYHEVLESFRFLDLRGSSSHSWSPTSLLLVPSAKKVQYMFGGAMAMWGENLLRMLLVWKSNLDVCHSEFLSADYK